MGAGAEHCVPRASGDDPIRPTECSCYVADADRRDATKLIVAVNYILKTTQGKIRANAFRTASLISLADVRKEVAAGGLVLLQGSLD